MSTYFLREVDLRHPNLVYFLEIRVLERLGFTHLTDWNHSYSVTFGDSNVEQGGVEVQLRLPLCLC